MELTEKRFKLIEDYDWWGVTDNQLPKTESGFREDLPNGYLSCDYEYNDLTPQEVVDLLNNLSNDNEELKESVNNLKETIIKITIAYQRKYDRSIVKLVHEVHDEDISDLIKELSE